MTELRLDTEEGALILDEFIDSASTIAVGAPAHLDEPTLAFIARIQKAANERVRDAEERAQRAAADATHEAVELIAADFDDIQASGRGLLMPPGSAAARVRSMAALLTRRAA
jgi:hypothetical protein